MLKLYRRKEFVSVRWSFGSVKLGMWFIEDIPLDCSNQCHILYLCHLL